MGKTLTDLQQRAKTAIHRREQICFDLSSNICQDFDNIKHTKLFLRLLMEAIAADYKTWGHLLDANGNLKDSKKHTSTIK